MSLSRKRRRKQEQRQHHENHPARRTSAVDSPRGGDAGSLSPEQLFGLQSARDEPSAPQETGAELRDADEAPPTIPSLGGLQEAEDVERLAYTRRQAAEALGVSISTIDRRVVPTIETVKTPWGQRLIPVGELERFMSEYVVSPEGRPRRARRPAGRPSILPTSVVERIRLDYARGRCLAEIARALTDEGVPTAHDGRRWWPSTVRAVLVRSSSITTAEPASRLESAATYTG